MLLVVLVVVFLDSVCYVVIWFDLVVWLVVVFDVLCVSGVFVDGGCCLCDGWV